MSRWVYSAVTSLVEVVTIALAIVGLAVTLGVMFRIFKWAAGL